MTAARLRALLAHHEPERGVRRRRRAARRPHPAVAPLLTGDARARRGARRPPGGRSGRVGRRGAARSASAPSPRATPPTPTVLRHDPQPPAVLFVRGDWSALDARRVGIVGTRNATGPGREIAATLGRGLAEAGVAVVSGLAKGIDGAAHRGALRAPDGRAVAVVGNGLDTPVPAASNAELWDAVGERGLLLSEWPPGTAPERVPVPAAQPHPRRPQRGARGGREPRARRLADHRREAALERVDRGDGGARARSATAPRPAPTSCSATAPRRSPTPTTCCVALGLDTGAPAGGLRPAAAAARRRGRRCSSAAGATRARSTTSSPTLGLPITEAAMALARLERSGWVREAGGWFEAVVSWSRRRRDPTTLDRWLSASDEASANTLDSMSRASPTTPTARRSWRLDSFAQSLTSLSAHTVARLRRRRPRLRRVGGAGGDHRARRRSSARPVRRYLAYLTTRAVRPAQHRPQGGRAAPLLRLVACAGAWRRPTRRSGVQATRRRRPAAPRARPPRPRRAARRAAAPDGRAGVAPRAATTPCSRCSTARACGSASCAGSTSSSLDLAAARRRGVGQGRQGAPGAAVARRRSRALRRWLRAAPRGRAGATGADAGGAVRQRARAAGSRRATCAASSTGGRRRRRIRTRCATASPPTCSTAAPTCGRCRSCSGTRDVATTQRYTHVSRERLRAAYNSAPPAGVSERREHRRRRPVPRACSGTAGSSGAARRPATT